MTTLIVSAAPIAARAATESQICLDSANTIVARPKAITAWNIRIPTRRVSTAVINRAPAAGAARITPSAQGPTSRMSQA